MLIKEYTIVNHMQIFHSNTLPEIWKLFESEKKVPGDIQIRIAISDKEIYALSLLPPQPGASAFLCEQALVSANDDWSKASVTLLEGRKEGLLGALNGILFTHLSTRKGLLLHASLVEKEGRGIMFLGPSGIGKTTQAELWAKHRDACIVNGDMVYVAFRDGQYLGYGSPWHGSSSYCENRSVPLTGLVILEQAQKNSIRKLKGMEMVNAVMKSTFQPVWYEPGVAGVMETLDGLLEKVPVFLLRCRPDREAVEVLEGALTRENG